MKKQPVPKKRRKPETRTFSIRLETTMIDEIDKMARENGTRRNPLIQIAIAKLLKQGL
jgi:metal-responsive CopG/Arc/MetJ family transcriptional regulator